MKRLLLIMILMTSISYAEVIFAPEIEGTKWIEVVDKEMTIIIEFTSPYIIFKSYIDSKLDFVGNDKVSSYDKVDDLHFMFSSPKVIPEMFKFAEDDVLQWIYIDSSDKNPKIITRILQPYKE